MEALVWFALLSAVVVASGLAVRSLHRPAPAPQGDHVCDAGWVADVGPLAALKVVERELRDIAGRTPLPGGAGTSAAIEVRYRACRRQVLAVGAALRSGDHRERAVAALLDAAPPAGMQVSPTVRAFESRDLVLQAIDRLQDNNL
jgi:hypothetical protein